MLVFGNKFIDMVLSRLNTLHDLDEPYLWSYIETAENEKKGVIVRGEQVGRY